MVRSVHIQDNPKFPFVHPKQRPTFVGAAAAGPADFLEIGRVAGCDAARRRQRLCKRILHRVSMAQHRKVLLRLQACRGCGLFSYL